MGLLALRPGGSMLSGEKLVGGLDNLTSAPSYLFFICLIQLVMLLIGVLIGLHTAECTVLMPSGAVVVDCTQCRKTGLTFGHIILLLVGMSVIGVGMYAAMFRDKQFCKIYGMIMMVYAFVIGLTAILTGLETPLYVEALQHVEDPRCREMAQMMVNTNRNHAILYGINCILDCAGAIFAIQSHQVFEYEDIESNHRSAEADNPGL